MATALRAGLHRLVFGKLLANDRRFGLTVAPFHIRDDSLEAVTALNAAAPTVEIGEIDPLVTAAEQDHFANILWQLLERLFDIELVVLGQ